MPDPHSIAHDTSPIKYHFPSDSLMTTGPPLSVFVCNNILKPLKKRNYNSLKYLNTLQAPDLIFNSPTHICNLESNFLVYFWEHCKSLKIVIDISLFSL